MRVVLLGVLLVACSGSSGGGDATGFLTVDDYSEQEVDAYCAKAFQCCNASDREALFADTSGQVTDQASCSSYYRAAYERFAANLIHTAIGAGRIDYDSSAGSACLAATAALTCAVFARTAGKHDCPNPIVGQVADTEACNFDEECASGYCEGDIELPIPMQGVCKELPGQGGSCPEDACAAGVQCANGTCEAQLPDGASCTEGVQCTSQGCNGADGLGGAGTCGAPTACIGG
jgi:hypothetical protein